MNLDLWYRWFLVGHIVAVIFWMAPLYYLPRLFVYHAETLRTSARDQAKIFEVMEARLAQIIMTPALLAAWVFGLLLLSRPSFTDIFSLWFYIKFTAIVVLTLYHVFLLICLRRFRLGQMIYSPRFFRLLNEIPPLLTILIVIMVIIRPF